MLNRIDALRDEAGFTIIEVMVAATLLVVGVLGVAKMADQASQASNASKARVGATNLARELLEDARTFSYEDFTGTVPAGSGTTTLQDAFAGDGITDARPSMTGFQVNRRGITFTVSAFTCVYDDSHDGVRAAPGGGNPDTNAAGPYCLGSPAAGSGATTDANPDDSRKVEVSVSWSLYGIPSNCRGASQTTTSGATGGTGIACVTQSELIPNPSGGLGPAIKTFTQTSPTGTVEAGLNSVAMNLTTASPAQSVTWTADDGKSGPATQGADATQWSFTWGTFTSTSPPDGTHILTAQAFLLNAGGVPKEVSVQLNRFIPAVPSGGTGGIDRRTADAAAISWSPNADQDIFGYTVYRAGGNAPVLNGGSPNDTPVCSTTSVSSTLCFDAPANLQNFATNAACTNSAQQAAGDKCIDYYVVPFDSKWTTIANPSTYGSTECPGTPWGSVSIPSSPSSVAPLTASPLWPTARAGCPSGFISIDYTTLSQNHAPDPPTAVGCSTDSGQPVITWTPPASPDQDFDQVVSYRIYRDPPSAPPGYNDPVTTIGYNGGSTTSYKDSAPTGGTGHEYYISSVDERFQESTAQHVSWTSATCP